MARKIVRELAEDEPKRKVKVTIAPDMTADGDKNLLGLVLQNYWAMPGNTPVKQQNHE